MDGRSTGQRAPSPAPFLEEPLQVLPSGDQQRLAIDPPEPSQPKPSQPMPVFGFREQRLDPDLPFAHGLLICFGQMVSPYPIQI